MELLVANLTEDGCFMLLQQIDFSLEDVREAAIAVRRSIHSTNYH
jgi:hypothetical protein